MAEYAAVDILYLDSNLIVLDKPAGLPVLPEGWDHGAPSVVGLLGQEHGRVWMVHRLDKLTSGVMVVARNPEVHRHLNAQFEAHEVVKIYHAVTLGAPRWNLKQARHPLRANVGHRHRTILDASKGKASRTDFRVLKTAPEHALLEARPQTGRTHQIRAHAYLLGHPLVGDPLYGPGASQLIARPALHALSIRLKVPPDAWNAAAPPVDADDDRWEVRTFSAPYPADIQGLIDSLFA